MTALDDLARAICEPMFMTLRNDGKPCPSCTKRAEDLLSRAVAEASISIHFDSAAIQRVMKDVRTLVKPLPPKPSLERYVYVRLAASLAALVIAVLTLMVVLA